MMIISLEWRIVRNTANLQLTSKCVRDEKHGRSANCDLWVDTKLPNNTTLPVRIE